MKEETLNLEDSRFYPYKYERTSGGDTNHFYNAEGDYIGFVRRISGEDVLPGIPPSSKELRSEDFTDYSYTRKENGLIQHEQCFHDKEGVIHWNIVTLDTHLNPTTLENEVRILSQERTSRNPQGKGEYISTTTRYSEEGVILERTYIRDTNTKDTEGGRQIKIHEEYDPQTGNLLRKTISYYNRETGKRHVTILTRKGRNGTVFEKYHPIHTQ